MVDSIKMVVESQLENKVLLCCNKIILLQTTFKQYFIPILFLTRCFYFVGINTYIKFSEIQDFRYIATFKYTAELPQIIQRDKGEYTSNLISGEMRTPGYQNFNLSRFLDTQLLWPFLHSLLYVILVLFLQFFLFIQVIKPYTHCVF